MEKTKIYKEAVAAANEKRKEKKTQITNICDMIKEETQKEEALESIMELINHVGCLIGELRYLNTFIKVQEEIINGLEEENND